MSVITVRPCSIGDLQVVTTIYAEAVLHGTATFELVPPDVAEMQRRFEALQANGYPYVVAELDGAVVGYAYAGPYRQREAYRTTAETSIYIDGRYHRRGVGRALLAELIDLATKADFRQLIGIVGDSTNISSIALHEAAGFTRAGTLRNVGFKHGRWLDTVLMQRPLGVGALNPP